MDPEFKTFIDSVAPSCAEAERHANGPNPVQNTVRRLKEWLVLVADILNAIGPYSCELRPFRKIKSVYAECSVRREAIGHHGLI
jgi:hypothetical protein